MMVTDAQHAESIHRRLDSAETGLTELCRVLEEKYQRELFLDPALAIAHRTARIALDALVATSFERFTDPDSGKQEDR
jgi:hypothetical protein